MERVGTEYVFLERPAVCRSGEAKNLRCFDWDDFKQARIRHWLATWDATYTHYDTLSVEQAPSPDGTTEGQLTWFRYAGKTSGLNGERGTQIMPSVIARFSPMAPPGISISSATALPERPIRSRNGWLAERPTTGQ